MYLIAALAAALMFAVSTVLKHRSAQSVSAATAPAHESGLIALIRNTMRHPAWLAAICVDAAALTMQVIALHLGPLTIVQPLLAVSIVIALLFDRHHVPRAVWAWSLLLVAAITAFVLLSGTNSPSTTPDAGPTVAATLAVAAVVVGCLAAARKLRPGLTAATTIGLGVGITYAASAALLKVLGNHEVQRGLFAVVDSWQLYAVIVCGAAGVLLNQLAFSAGPLRLSLPTISAVDPVVSVLLGVLVFDERLRVASGYWLAQLLTLLVVVVAIVKIGRARLHPEPADRR